MRSERAFLDFWKETSMSTTLQKMMYINKKLLKIILQTLLIREKIKFSALMVKNTCTKYCVIAKNCTSKIYFFYISENCVLTRCQYDPHLVGTVIMLTYIGMSSRKCYLFNFAVILYLFYIQPNTSKMAPNVE